MSYGVGHRRGSDPELLWLWCRLAAVSPIRANLAWEPPYAVGVALERQKKKKKVIFGLGPANCSGRGVAVVAESQINENTLQEN